MCPLTPRDHMRLIVAAVAAEYGVSIEAIYGRSRRQRYVIPRHAAIRAVAARFPQLSSVAIGRHFGRDHTSILYALGRIQKRRGGQLQT